MSRLILSVLIGAGCCAAQSQVGDVRQSVEQNLAATLQQDPNNVALLLKMGSMKLEDNAPDEAQSYYERVLALDPNNTTALYSLGAIGWSRVFTELRTARTQLAMDPETPGPLRDRATRAVLGAKYSRTISDSIADLERVLTIDPQNSDAMAYLNLVYRAKADLDDTPEAYSADINMAGQWVQKALQTARAKRPASTPGAPPPRLHRLLLRRLARSGSVETSRPPISSTRWTLFIPRCIPFIPRWLSRPGSKAR